MRLTCVGDNIEIYGEGEESLGGFELDLNILMENHKLLRFFSSRDKDVIYLIWMCQKSQNTIHSILDRSQPAICYYVARIKKKMRFVHWLDKAWQEVAEIFSGKEKYEWLTDDMKEILVLMLNFSSYVTASKLSKSCKNSTSKVKSTFSELTKKSKDNGAWNLYEICYNILKNIDIIRRDDILVA